MKKLFLIPVFALILAGCSSAIEKTADTRPEKPKAISEVTKVKSTNSQGAVFTDFTREKYSELLGKKPLALFFHASWCSTCTQLTREINQDIANFPAGTVILNADFDTETQLKQDYGIVMQATIVVIDKNGKVTKTLAAPSVDDLKEAIAQTV